ncbi:hypothetical protein [Streptomyces kanamyceticus]|uniref:Uncharacterized protein n=1 Tax=Streptomyces kanamyceticus TaxID=1967 RepID=A0A5J6GKC1_STRKN|nr:hypothetical protein [Streptomyces kanamyceticus]QEU94268.1 hypothetical protein CP970_28185 [Streptomyces kanamyceticus]
MSRRRALAVLTLATLALSPVAAARADTAPLDTQSCRITGHTADQGPYITVTSIPHPITAQRCRDLGGTVTSAMDVYVVPPTEDTVVDDTLTDTSLTQDADLAVESEIPPLIAP